MRASTPQRLEPPLVHEKRGARGRDRLAVCRTRSSHPWSLIGCSRQPVVLQTASRSLPERPITEIMGHIHNNCLSACPAGAGCLPQGPRLLPQALQDIMRMTQLSVGKRKRLALFRTTNCREQLISDQGWLERVLKRAKRFRLIALRFSQTRFVHTNSGRCAHRILDFQGIQRCWNSNGIKSIPDPVKQHPAFLLAD